jgi:pilus assembly protein CpaF
VNDNLFSQIDFGALKEYLENDDVTDISYSNNGQLWIKTLSKGLFRVENPNINNAFIEKLAFQCSNVMGKSFNMAHPFLDAEGAELRLNFIHDSIAKNGIAVVIRKTPAKIRLEKDKLLREKYIDLDIHDFLIKCVHGHCNIIVSGETGSGKTEFVKYLAAHTKEDEKIITIEDTLELHLDRIFPHRDIVAMKTNNIASYSDVLVTCMRQNPKWILLSEVRSAEAVMAVRNSISSGHYILSTIHADKASSIPNRMYSLLETNQDINQFLKSIYRYIQLGVYIRGFQDKATKHFVREIAEVTEFYVTEDNEAKYNTIYRKSTSGKVTRKHPTKYLIDYLDAQGVTLNQNEIQDSETVVSRDFSVFAEEDKEKMQQQMVNQNPTTNQARPGIINNNQMPNVNQAKSNNQRVASQNVRVVPTNQVRQAQPRITPTSVIKAQPSVVQSQNQVVTNQPNINASSINQNKIENLESMFE